MHEDSRAPKSPEDGSRPFRSTRIRSMSPDDFDPTKPRLGRRESEPHSSEVTYLFDVLTTNFPADRTLWDLHHYFRVDGIALDLQFDISYFRDLQIPYALSSYRAERFNSRVPTMAINVLSKSTWKTDIGETVDHCKLLEIPLYVVFPPFHVATAIYRPPFLRAYFLQDDGDFQVKELKQLTVTGQGEINSDAIIDTSSIVPFRLGLVKRKRKYDKNLPLYRLIILAKDELKVLPTKFEKEQRRVDEEQRRADEAEAELKALKRKFREK